MKNPDNVIWKLRTISRKLGVSESSLKRWIRESGLKLLKYKGATCIPECQILELKSRLLRSNDGEGFAILFNKGHTWSEEGAHEQLSAGYNQEINNNGRNKRDEELFKHQVQTRPVGKSCRPSS